MVGISIPGENSSSRNVIHERIIPMADNYSRMFCNRFGMKLALGAVLLMIFVISITTVTKGNTGPWDSLDTLKISLRKLIPKDILNLTSKSGNLSLNVPEPRFNCQEIFPIAFRNRLHTEWNFCPL